MPRSIAKHETLLIKFDKMLMKLDNHISQAQQLTIDNDHTNATSIQLSTNVTATRQSMTTVTRILMLHIGGQQKPVVQMQFLTSKLE